MVFFLLNLKSTHTQTRHMSRLSKQIIWCPFKQNFFNYYSTSIARIDLAMCGDGGRKQRAKEEEPKLSACSSRQYNTTYKLYLPYITH